MVPAPPPSSFLPSAPQTLQVWALHTRQGQMLFSRSNAELQWDSAETSGPCRSITATATLSAALPVNSYRMRILKHSWKTSWKHFLFTDEKCSSLCSAELKKKPNPGSIKLSESANCFVFICAASHSVVTRSLDRRKGTLSYLLCIYSSAEEKPFLPVCDESSPFTWCNLVSYSLLSLPGSVAEGDTRAWQVFSCDRGEVLTPRNPSRWFGASLL